MPLTGLLMPDDRSPLPALTISSPAGDFPPVITETAPGIHAEVVLHGTQPQDTVIDGITVDTQERLLLTTPAGIVRADLSSGALGWAAPIPGCRGSALQRADGSILVICGETVLRWDGHDCQILAGGFTGGTSLLPGPDGQEWVFDYKTAQWMQSGMSVTLTRLGDGLGQEERHTIDFRAGIWSAVWLSGLRFFLAGDGHFGLVDLDNTTTVPIGERLRSPHPDQRGAVRIDEHTVMTATRPRHRLPHRRRDRKEHPHGATRHARARLRPGFRPPGTRLRAGASRQPPIVHSYRRRLVRVHAMRSTSRRPAHCCWQHPRPRLRAALPQARCRHHPDPSARSWMSRHGGMSGPSRRPACSRPHRIPATPCPRPAAPTKNPRTKRHCPAQDGTAASMALSALTGLYAGSTG